MPFNDYTLGRGRVYLDRLDNDGESTGWRYLGNTPTLNLTKDIQTLDHYDSDSGLKQKDKSVTLQEDIKLAFETDNINEANIALWFGADSEESSIAALTAQTQSIVVEQGLSYAIGENLTTGALPRHNLTAIAFTVGTGTPVAIGAGAVDDNLIVDMAGGMITVLEGAPAITDGATLNITYSTGLFVEKRTLDNTKTVFARMRFVSDNPVGSNRVHYWPYVKVTPSGDMALKGDDWQKLSFAAEVLKGDAALGRYRIRSTPAQAA